MPFRLALLTVLALQISCLGDLGPMSGSLGVEDPTYRSVPPQDASGQPVQNPLDGGALEEGEDPPLVPPTDPTDPPTPPAPTTPVDAGPAPSVRKVPAADAMPYSDAALYATGCEEGGGSGLATNQAMIDHLNAQRKSYTTHLQISGYPWVGGAIPQATWKTVLLKNDELMERAQIFAAELAKGGQPLGKYYERQFASLFQAKYDSEPMWLHGLDTAEYRISAKSKLQLTQGPNGLPLKWHHRDNGTIRQAIFYQSGMPPFPNKRHIGVGRACLPDGDVWWVVLIAEY